MTGRKAPKRTLPLYFFFFLSICGAVFGRVVLQSLTDEFDQANQVLFSELKTISVGEHFDFCKLK